MINNNNNNTSRNQRGFSPIFETDDFKLDDNKDSNVKVSKSSIKGSKVSFQEKFDSDEDDFPERRDHFQSRKTQSTADHKSVFKVSLLTF